MNLENIWFFLGFSVEVKVLSKKWKAMNVTSQDNAAVDLFIFPGGGMNLKNISFSLVLGKDPIRNIKGR